METNDNKFTWQFAVAEAIRRVGERGLQRIQQPIHRYTDLGEIDNIEFLSDDVLANMLIRYNAWYSYATSELAFAKASLQSLNEMWEVLVAEGMVDYSKTSEVKLTKDVLRGMAIRSNTTLDAYFKERVLRMEEATILEGMVKSLDIRSDAVKSEFIRRASDKKVMT